MLSIFLKEQTCLFKTLLRWVVSSLMEHCCLFRHYELKRNEDIVSFFNDFSDHLAEEALWELSLKIKPRNITRRKTDREEKT